MRANTRILFISRAYPPVVGGMENQNYGLARHLSKIADVRIVANRHGKKILPFFLPYVSIRSLFLIRQFDVLLLGDGVLAIVGYLVKLFYGRTKKVVCVLHGLDITYSFWFYRWLWVGKFIPSLDKLTAVGNETIKQGTKRGIPEEKFVFIPNGVDPYKHIGNYSRSGLERVAGEKLEDKKILLTAGRLAKRKGVAWFVRNVMPRLDENIIYVVLGDGPDRKNIAKAVEEKKLDGRVKLLGYQPDETRDVCFNTADIFIQPNIRVPGDMEGFGISVLEATTCKLPVVVANTEGLKDAIKDGENGFLVESGNADAWLKTINELLADDDFRKKFGEKARRYTIENYSWEKIAKKYLEEIQEVAKR